MSTTLRLMCILAVLMCSGCVDRTPWRCLEQSDAPWIDHGVRADLQERWGAIVFPLMVPAGLPDQHRYVHPVTGIRINPVTLARHTERFLYDRGAFEVYLAPAFEHRSEMVEGFERWQRGQSVRTHLALRTPVQMNLVCLDPVVVVVSQEESLYNYQRRVMRRTSQQEVAGQPGTTRHTQWESLPILPGGFVPRTRFKAVGELEWFSPTLEQGRIPLEFDDRGVAQIEVPWGYLHVQLQDGFASVTSTADD